MKIKIWLLLMVVLGIHHISSGQNSYTLIGSFESLLSTGEQQPFWITNNQYGLYPKNGNAIQTAMVQGSFQKEKLFSSPLALELGTRLLGSYSTEFAAQVNELYAKSYFKGWKLEGGWFREAEYWNGLSSTNGNIDRSNNARPYPRLRFGTNEFIPFLFWKNWFSFKAEYDEGWLNDERIVMGTRLHHKSLYTKFKITQNSSFHVGLNHYVMWGGTSPSHGELPQGFRDYFTYITGSVGGENFPLTDQFNVAGNQFGSYHVQYKLELANTTLSLYLNHLFEDHSGMEWRNPKDNLYGLVLRFKKAKIVHTLLYEYMYTLHQGGSVHVQGSTGLDNYYSHGVYNSGYSYQGRMMVSPLFSPLRTNADGVITGLQNNRIIMHHLGINGTVSKEVSWDAKFTYSKNYGSYGVPFDPVRNQFSSILNTTYRSEKFPLDLTFSLAADVGDLYENSIGARIKVSKSF